MSFLTKLFSREEDKRSDPEDADAYTHAEKVKAEQVKEAFPVQTLRGQKLPTDAKVTEVKWEAPPAGFESWVDVYEGPQGVGYVVNYEVEKGGKKLRKRVNYGPEKHNEQDWEEVKDQKV